MAQIQSEISKEEKFCLWWYFWFLKQKKKKTLPPLGSLNYSLFLQKKKKKMTILIWILVKICSNKLALIVRIYKLNF